MRSDLQKQTDWQPFHVVFGLCLIGIFSFVCLINVQVAVAQETAADSADTPPAKKVDEPERAWEYDRYDVRVWMIHDESYQIRSIFDRLIHRLERDTQLVDPIAWNVECEKAPPIWNHRLGKDLDDPTRFSNDIVDLEELAGFDKLIVVSLDHDSDGYHVLTREFDMFTRHWGALVEFTASDAAILSNQIYESVATAFMPLTQIERVTKQDDVFVRLRAVALAIRFDGIDENGEAIIVPNELSPTWVRDDDVLLPIVRRIDKKTEKVSKVSVIEWTYLLIEENLKTTLRCRYETSQYFPLAGRSGKYIQKMALVIRPPTRSTRVTLISKDPKNPIKLQGIKVYSRTPTDKAGEASEFLGKTDWKGSIEIHPGESAVRLLYLMSGQGFLAKLPVIPGLFDELTAKMPDDKQRLFAEGIVKGLQGELVDLLTRRNMFKTRIEIAMEKGLKDDAMKLFDDEYDQLPDSRDFGLKLSRTKEKLLSRGKPDNRQRERISKMFSPIEKLIKKFIKDSEKTELMNLLTGKTPVEVDAPEDGELGDDGPVEGQ